MARTYLQLVREAINISRTATLTCSSAFKLSSWHECWPTSFSSSVTLTHWAETAALARSSSLTSSELRHWHCTSCASTDSRPLFGACRNEHRYALGMCGIHWKFWFLKTEPIQSWILKTENSIPRFDFWETKPPIFRWFLHFLYQSKQLSLGLVSKHWLTIWTLDYL